MSRIVESPLARVLGFVVAVVIPLVGSLLASRRQIEVAAAFLLHELSSVPSLGMLLLMMGPVIVGGASIFLRRRGRGSLQAVNVQHMMTRWRALWAALAVISLFVTAAHLRVRYRLFSESAFQYQALAAVDEGEIAEARSICARYLSLYPHRRSAGTFPDPICTPIMQFSDGMASLYGYLAEQTPTDLTVDQITIRHEPAARAQALEILEEWSGR